jgi:transposase
LHIINVSNNGKSYLKLAESYGVSENGKVKTKKRIIKNIGPLSKFDDGKPDYLDRLRKSFVAGTPLISELDQYCQQDKDTDRILLEFDKKNLDHCFSNPRNIGYLFLEKLYQQLGIYDVLALYKSHSNIGYDLNGLTKLLIYGRLLSPQSKQKTFESRHDYLFRVTSSEHLEEVYRSLDAIDTNSEKIQKRMNSKILKSIGRNTEMCYYDVTNYYFETHQPDEDLFNEDGELVSKGLRKKGYSKEKRSEPIVQMGLFIDDNGIPISYRLFSGNDTDITTLRPALKESIDKMNFGRVVVVADGGLNSDKNIAHILGEGNGYIVSKSIRKSSKKIKSWALDEADFVWNQDQTFKVKSKSIKRTIKDENGVESTIEEKIICFWSKAHYDKQMNENNSFNEYLKTVEAAPEKLKSKAKKVEKYLVKTEYDKETGEVKETQTKISINWEKIKEEQVLFGYYTILTSELEKTDAEIINKYHGLSRIEDSFRIIKSDLEGRPVFVRTQSHINAHFLICFVALTMIRLIQYKILKNNGKDTLNSDGWESGLTAERIRNSLNEYMADSLPDGYYRLNKPSDDLKMILDALGIDGELRLPTLSELQKLKSEIKKKDFLCT